MVVGHFAGVEGGGRYTDLRSVRQLFAADKLAFAVFVPRILTEPFARYPSLLGQGLINLPQAAVLLGAALGFVRSDGDLQIGGFLQPALQVVPDGCHQRAHILEL